MEHIIQTVLGRERFDAFVDGVPYSRLCSYTTNSGSLNTVYVKDDGHDVVIEQDEEAAIIGLFSTAKADIPQLMDYIESTLSRKSGFGYCLAGDMQRYLRQASEQGGRYPFLSNALNPQSRSPASDWISRLQPQRRLAPSLHRQVRAHTVTVEHSHESYMSEPDPDIMKQPAHFIGKLLDPRSTPVITFAEGLPEGWHWREYYDGSGDLRSPKGNIYFIHGMPSALGDTIIAYVETIDHPWETFHGSVQDFRKNAESIINTQYLHRKDSLDNIMQTAATKTSVVKSSDLTKVKEPGPER